MSMTPYKMLIIFVIPKQLLGLIKIFLDVIKNKVKIKNYLSSCFPIEKGLK